MEKAHQDIPWVPHAEISPEPCGPGVQRRVLAYSKDAMCVENTFETGGVGAMHCHGDTLLKQDGVMHGCVCLEAGILLDFFTPMREDFV